MTSSSPVKKERREIARERARAEREAVQQKARRNKFLIQGGFIVGLLAIVTIVVLVITSAPPVTQTEAGPENMLSDGILFTGEDGTIEPLETPGIAAGGEPVTSEYEDDGVANIVTYIDFSCPACRAFEEANASYIQELVASGEATLEVRPIAILDRYFQGTRYSTRSANAGACVANHEPESFLDVSAALFANQPAEGTPGLSNDQLTTIVEDAGVTSEVVSECIAGETFRPWVEAATARATEGELPGTDGVTLEGTPTVLVNGEPYEGSINDRASFAAFVESFEPAEEG